MGPKKAQRFTPWRPFARNTRTKGNTRPVRELQSDQRLQMSSWGTSSTRRVDTERVNWRGIVYMQQECGVYDPRPRLRRAQ